MMTRADDRLLDLEPGKKLALQDLQRLATSSTSWKELPEAEMMAMVECLHEHRQQKLKGSKSHATGHLNDVRATNVRVADELKRLSFRCSTSSLSITVRTEPGHPNDPHYFNDQLSESFIEAVVGMTFAEFCAKYEAFSLFSLKGTLIIILF
jgi:hypothetical protein